MLVRFKAQNHRQQIARRGALSAVDDRATEPEFFARLNARFRFTLDVAAAAANAKLPRYFDRSADGLAQSWAGERVWCNPPYSDLRPWVEKAWAEPAALVVMLVPANRTEQPWWQELIEPFRDRSIGPELRVEFLPGRLRFIDPGASAVRPNDRPPFGCCLLIWAKMRPA